MTHRRIVAVLLWLLVPGAAHGQSNPLNLYLTPAELTKGFEALANAGSPAPTPVAEIENLLPLKRAHSFVTYVLATQPALAQRGIESLRLNKMLQSTASAGGTSAVASAIGPAVLGAAIEYGGVIGESTGTTTTLRANMLGVARLLLGAEQFPYCPAIDPRPCHPWSRGLRRLSGSVSFEPTSAPAGASTAAAAPSAADLLGSAFRVSSWSARVELTEAGRLDDPAYARAWAASIEKLRGQPQPAAVSIAVDALFGGRNLELYASWRQETVAALRSARSRDEFQRVFEERLPVLTDVLLAADPSFANALVAASRAFSAYLAVRDELVRQAQVHKASIEYTSHAPASQPATSNVRLIYSHQPTQAPLVFTLNAALTIYNARTDSPGRFRDLQLAGQIDRPLGRVVGLGPTVLTLAAYYQWMKNDAAIDAGKTAAASLAGLTLADDAATVLATAGHIVVVQGKVSIPINDQVKVPVSLTWANRRELLPASHTVRGQVGLSIDLDGVFK